MKWPDNWECIVQEASEHSAILIKKVRIGPFWKEDKTRIYRNVPICPPLWTSSCDPSRRACAYMYYVHSACNVMPARSSATAPTTTPPRMTHESRLTRESRRLGGKGRENIRASINRKWMTERLRFPFSSFFLSVICHVCTSCAAFKIALNIQTVTRISSDSYMTMMIEAEKPSCHQNKGLEGLR